MKINLGDKVKDTVTGFKGIAIARTIWLHGCARITVQPEGVQKDGKLYETQVFDEPQLIVLTVKKRPEAAWRMRQTLIILRFRQQDTAPD